MPDSLPLVPDAIPPFVCGRGGHWQWLLRQLVVGRQRVAVDATSAVTAAMIMDGVSVERAAHRERSHSQLWLAGGCERGGLGADFGGNGGGEGGAEGEGDGGKRVWAGGGGGGAWHCEVNRRLEEQAAEQQRRVLDEGMMGLHTGSSSSSGGSGVGRRESDEGGVDGKTTGGKKKEVPQFSVSIPSTMDLPWAAMPCHATMTSTSVCLLPRVRPSSCPCELAPFHGHTASDSIPAPQDPLYFTCSVPAAVVLHSESHRAASANLSGSSPTPTGSQSSGFEGQSTAAAAVGGGAGEVEGGGGGGEGAVVVRRGHSLQVLLPVVADRHGVVVLVAVSDGDQDMLLSFVCMLRHLNITNFLIAATDLPILSFAYLHSLPVFHLPSLDTTPLSSSSSTSSLSPAHCTSLTCRRRHSMHVRSRAALAIVRLGYHVASTLIDTVWFHNPLPDLLAFGPNAVAIQSSVTDVEQPANSVEGTSTMSTGFFFVRGEEKSAAALAAVVAHAGGSRMAEHLSFFRVLCGENGQLLVS
ncbi:unnamed protein product [Closterium sp. Naga37s-1]|nr:unnamed protein product [Closterium sp. Naga37s-1]